MNVVQSQGDHLRRQRTGLAIGEASEIIQTLVPVPKHRGLGSTH